MGAMKLTIYALPGGGIIVAELGGFGERDQEVFASSTLDEALAYVRTRMRPEGEAEPASEAETHYGGQEWAPDELQRQREIRAALIGGVAGPDAYARDMDQGALSREAMTAAVHRRNGMWRV